MRLLPALVLIAACTNADKGLGDAAEDNARLADSTVLAHFADALENPDATVLDLFGDKTLPFVHPPDADSLFQTSYERHISLPELTGEPLQLRVLTFNTGLLSRKYLLSKVAVPQIEARRAVMADRLFSAGYDILMLQEVWELDDAQALIDAGEAAGYTVWAGDGKKFHKETGVVLAVRADLIAGNAVQNQGQYQAQWKIENFPGPNLKRGWISWEFDLADTGVHVHLFDTHFTPFYSEWNVRNLQARELGQIVAAVPAEDVVLLGGDLNAGWYYPEDTWVDGEGEEGVGWWANAVMAPLLMYYGGLEDAKNAASPNEDVFLGDTIPRGNGEAMLEEPYGDPLWCGATPHTTYTAYDCNSLSFESYAGTEFPARLDHLFFRDGSGKLRITDQALAFDAPLTFDEGEFELSDHYGVEVSLEIGE